MEQHLSQNSMQNRMQILKNSIQFLGIDITKLNEISAISQYRQWGPGQIIYDIGDPSDAIYIILSGQADYVYSPNAGARKLGTKIETGDIAGWAALLKNRPPRPGQVVAQTDVEAVIVPAEALADIFQDNPVAWKTIVSRFATMVSRDYSVPAHIPEIQQEIVELEVGAYEMEKKLLRQKMAGIQPVRRRISPAERFHLIQQELERLAHKIGYQPYQLDQAWRQAGQEVDSMFEVEMPLINTNNLPNWG